MRTCGTGGRSAPPRAVLPLLIALLFSAPASAQVVVNEVLYDPDGPDTGLEFVEIRNCGRDDVLLTGWVLESGNGAGPGDWTVEWIGDDFDVLGPGECMVVGEADVVPPPDYVTSLDLQNGPDGVRLTDGTAVVDVVGWGEPLFPEYCEGDPAVDVPSGSSLARSPDCFDHDDNSFDLVACPTPTPGSGNTPEHDLSLRVLHAGRVEFDVGEPVSVACVVANVGSLPTGGEPGSLRLFVDGSDSDEGGLELATELAVRESLEASVEWTEPRAGYHRIELRLEFEPDCSGENNTAETSVTVGGHGGRVALNEIAHSPSEGATEWVELVCTAGETVRLAGWMLGDAVDGWRVRSDCESLAVIAPGGFLLMARDGELADGSSCPVIETERWEALSAEDDVFLLDEYGTVMDRVSYEKSWGGGRDVSLERVRPDVPAQDARNWGSSVAPEGATPGRTNSIYLGATESSGRLVVSPNPFTPNGDGENDRAAVAFELPVARATVRLSVFDLEGRPRAILLDHEATSSKSELIWDGAGSDGSLLPSGLYVVYLEAMDARSGVYVTAKTAVGIVR